MDSREQFPTFTNWCDMHQLIPSVENATKYGQASRDAAIEECAAIAKDADTNYDAENAILALGRGERGGRNEG